MIIPYTTTKVYDWFDIQKAICEQMDMPEKYFRDYHKYPAGPGGDYKDLWHLCLEYIIPDNMTNDSYVKVWPIFQENLEEIFTELPWSGEFFNAVICVLKTIDPDNEGVVVSFCW